MTRYSNSHRNDNFFFSEEEIQKLQQDIEQGSAPDGVLFVDLSASHPHEAPHITIVVHNKSTHSIDKEVQKWISRSNGHRLNHVEVIPQKEADLENRKLHRALCLTEYVAHMDCRTQKEYAKGEEMLRAAMNLCPDIHDFVINYIGFCVQVGNNNAYVYKNFQEAIKYYQKALEHDFNDPEIWIHLGNAHAENEELLQALESWQVALNFFNWNHPEHLTNISIIIENMCLVLHALKAQIKVILKDPTQKRFAQEIVKKIDTIGKITTANLKGIKEKDLLELMKSMKKDISWLNKHIPKK